MRLFHVSEDPNITVFHPRVPSRPDLDPHIGLVWAIDEARLPNFLTPRDCPRVTYHIGKDTTKTDIDRFFSSSTVKHAVIIEHGWLQTMQNTPLYLYEFDPTDFVLQDSIAGYYVSQTVQTPIARHVITDPLQALADRNIELRMVDSLWDIADRIRSSTLNWSLCRMKNASPKNNIGHPAPSYCRMAR